MGNQKLKWKAEEEEALRAGVAKHGTGKWKIILDDPEFAPFLTHRSNIDLKDKWRNLSITPGMQGSRERSRAPKVKENADGQTSGALIPISAVPAVPQQENDSRVGPSKCQADAKLAPRYRDMIFEAILSQNDEKGADVNAIVSYIEQRHEMPQNFRKLLFGKLRKLVLQGKLEKVDRWYKIKDGALETPKPLNVSQACSDRAVACQTRQPSIASQTIAAAARDAAYRVAEAENKAFVAAEAVKEADRIEKMAEDNEALLHLVAQIHAECSMGEGVVFLR